MSSETTIEQNKQNGGYTVHCLTESRKDIELLSVKPLRLENGFIVGVNVTDRDHNVSSEIWTFNADAQLTSRKSFGKFHENPNNPTQTCFVSIDPTARAIDNWDWETVEGSDDGLEEMYKIELYAPKIVRTTLDRRLIVLAGSQLVVCYASDNEEHITTPYYTMRDGDKALVGQKGEEILSPVAISSAAKKEATEGKEHKNTDADSSGQSSATTNGSATTLATTLD